MNADSVLELAVFSAVDQVNEHLPSEKKLAKSAETALIGDSSGVNSLTLISFIVALEQTIELEYGKTISLSDDESILTDEEGSLANLSSLAEYLTAQLWI